MILDQNGSTKSFSAILAGSIKQNSSAQPAYFRFRCKASWEDLFHLIEPAKMAEKFFWWIHFGVGSCGR